MQLGGQQDEERKASGQAATTTAGAPPPAVKVAPAAPKSKGPHSPDRGELQCKESLPDEVCAWKPMSANLYGCILSAGSVTS